MVIDPRELLMARPELVLFLVLGLGCVLGKIRIKGFEVGRTAGVLFAGLFFGHLGFSGMNSVESIGFILFIYCVGVQAGPRFFSVVLQDGLKYLLLSACIALSGLSMAAVMGWLFKLEPGYAAGILAGALTSTPSLIASQDVVKGHELIYGNGLTGEDVMMNITTGYAITYVFGLVGLILFIRLFPMILRIDLIKEAKQLAKKEGIKLDSGEGPSADSTGMQVRAFKVTHKALFDQEITAIRAMGQGRALLARIKRGAEIIPLENDLILKHNDKVALVGYVDKLYEVGKEIGPEIDDEDLIQLHPEAREVVITNPEVAGKSLSDLALLKDYGCFVKEVRRVGMEVPVTPTLCLERGDVVIISGLSPFLDKGSAFLGMAEQRVNETDLITLTFGISIGLFCGAFVIMLGRIPVGLGTAGGLLLSGIAIGYLRSIFPVFGRVPTAARWIFTELGLLFFMASVGLRAGGGIIETLQNSGFSLVIVGVLVTLSPVLAGFIFGRLVLKLHPVMLLGALTGSMTSTPALNIVNEQTRSSLPALGYAGAYAFANVFLTIAGSLIMRI